MREWPLLFRRLILLLPLALWLGLVVGCGPAGPKSYAVRGRVVTAKAEDLKQLVGQGIEFQSTTEPNTRAFGQLQSDGTFTLATYRLGANLPGAIEGTHKARLQLGVGEDDRESMRKKKGSIDPKYTRFESSGWEVTVPPRGEVVLKLP